MQATTRHDGTREPYSSPRASSETPGDTLCGTPDAEAIAAYGDGLAQMPRRDARRATIHVMHPVGRLKTSSVPVGRKRSAASEAHFFV